MKIYEIDTGDWHPEKPIRMGSTIVKVILLPELVRWLDDYYNNCNKSIITEQGHNRFDDYPDEVKTEIVSIGSLITDIKRRLGVK